MATSSNYNSAAVRDAYEAWQRAAKIAAQKNSTYAQRVQAQQLAKKYAQIAASESNKASSVASVKQTTQTTQQAVSAAQTAASAQQAYQSTVQAANTSTANGGWNNSQISSSDYTSTDEGQANKRNAEAQRTIANNIAANGGIYGQLDKNVSVDITQNVKTPEDMLTERAQAAQDSLEAFEQARADKAAAYNLARTGRHAKFEAIRKNLRDTGELSVDTDSESDSETAITIPYSNKWIEYGTDFASPFTQLSSVQTDLLDATYALENNQYTRAIDKLADAQVYNKSYVALDDEDITAYLHDDTWYPAVVDNTNCTSGTTSSAWGYLITHCDKLNDGDFILVNNQGQAKIITQDNCSSDYYAQVLEWLADFNEAKADYESRYAFQELAAEGAAMANNTDTNDPTKANSLFDLAANFVNAYITDWRANHHIGYDYDEEKEYLQSLVDSGKYWVDDNGYYVPANTRSTYKTRITGSTLYKEWKYADEYAAAEQEWQNFEDSANDFWHGTATFQMFDNNSASSTEWQKLYADDPDTAIAELNNADLSHRKKAWLAYQMVTQPSWNLVESSSTQYVDDYFTEGLLNSLVNLGEVMDYVADPVKGVIMYLDWATTEEGGTWFTQGEYDEIFKRIEARSNSGAEAVWNVIKSAYQSTYANEGRVSYNYDTGCVPLDLVMEIISDPEMWVRAGLRAGELGLADVVQGAVKSSTDESISVLKPYQIIKKGIENGKTESEVVEDILRTLPTEARAGARQVVTDALAYGHQYNIAKSLGTVLDLKNGMDTVMMHLTQIPYMGYAFKGILKYTNIISDEAQVAASKAVRDAYTETVGESIEGVTLDNVIEYLDKTRKNFLGLQLEGVDVPDEFINMTNYQKCLIVMEAYENTVATLVGEGKTLTKEQMVMLQTQLEDIMVRLGLDDIEFYKCMKNHTVFGGSTYSKVPDVIAEAGASTDSINWEKIGEQVNEEVSLTNHHLYDTVGEVGDDLYALKMNERTMTDMYLSRPDFYELVQGTYNIDGKTIRQLQLELDSFGGIPDIWTQTELYKQYDAIKRTVDAATLVRRYKSAVDNYVLLSNTIKNSTNIPDGMKNQLLDYIFDSQWQRMCNNVHIDVADTELTVLNRSRNLAKHLIEDSETLELRMKGVDKLDYLHCNSWDTVANVNAIEDAYKTLGRESTDVQAFYSIVLENDFTIKEMTLKCGDEVLTFDGTRQGMIDMTDAFLRFEAEARHAGKQFELFGYNNHALGFDTDYYVQQIARRERTQLGNHIRRSVDLTNLLRGDFVDIPESVYAEVTDAIHQGMRNWRVDSFLYSVSTDGRRVPLSYSGVTRSELMQLCDTIDKSYPSHDVLKVLQGAFEDVDGIRYSYLDYGLVDKTSDLSRIMSKAEYAELGYAKVLNQKAASKWLGDFQSVGRAVDLKDDIALLEYYNKQYYDAEFFELFKDDIDDCYEAFENYIYSKADGYPIATYDALQSIHMIDEVSGTLVWKPVTTQDKVSVMRLVRTRLTEDLGWTDGLWDNLSGRCGSFMECINDANELLVRRTSKNFYVDASFVGNIDNPYASHNLEIQFNRQWNGLTDTFDKLDALEELRKELGIEDDLLQYRDSYRARVKAQVYDTAQSVRARLTSEFYSTSVSGDYIQTGKMFDDLPTGSKYANYWNQKQHSGIYDKFGVWERGFDEANVKARVGWYGNLTDEQWNSYFVHQCQGRLAINLDEIPVVYSTDLVNRTSRLAKQFGYNFDYKNGIIRTWIEMDDEAFAALRDSVLECTPKLDLGDDVLYKGINSDWQKFTIETQKLRDILVEEDSTFSYGMYVGSDLSTYQFFDNKYFSDIQGLPTVRNYNGAFCAYIGMTSSLLGEGSFVSGSTFTNMFNCANRHVNWVNWKDTLVDMLFQGNTYRKYCNGTDSAVVWDELAQRGYKVCALDDTGKIITVGSVKDAVKYTNVCVLSELDYKAMLEAIHSTPEYAGKKLSAWTRAAKRIRNIESKYFIPGYLYTNPATWVHNAVDSTLKGVVSEGFEHLGYIGKAKQALDSFAMLTDLLGDDFTPNGIIRFFDSIGDDVWQGISKSDALSLYQYKLSSISGAKWDDYLFTSFKAAIKKDGALEGISKVLDIDIFENMTADMFKQFTETEEFAKLMQGSEWLDKTIGKYYGFNAHMFSTVESLNRTAIFLKHIDAGETLQQAYNAIKLSQFDYSKTQLLMKSDTLFPFITFKLYNLKFWLIDAMNMPLAKVGMGNLANALYQYDPDEYTSNYWSEEAMQFRAWLDGFRADNADAYNANKEYIYNTFEDYLGSDRATAVDNGWIQIGDKAYFKLGLSMIDPLTTVQTFYTIADCVRSKNWLGALTAVYEDYGFAPVVSATNAWKGLEELFNNGFNPDAQWFSDYGYDVTTMIPLVSTFYYMIQSGIRNKNYLDRTYGDWSGASIAEQLSVWLPGLFVPRKQSTKTYSLYNKRDLGFDWYNASDAYKAVHQYVKGVSYQNSWINKDPANYINCYGRIQQMFGDEWAQEWANNARELGWFTMDENGEVKWHDYQLMIGDYDEYLNLKSRLIEMGWAEADAERLLDTAAYHTWQPAEGKVDYFDEYHRLFGYETACNWADGAIDMSDLGWFTKDEDGTVHWHNYTLIAGDAQERAQMVENLTKLLEANNYSSDEIKALIEAASVPTSEKWKNYLNNRNYYNNYTNGEKSYSGYKKTGGWYGNYTGNGYGKYSGQTWIATPKSTAKPRNMHFLSDSLKKGKNAFYSGTAQRAARQGHDTTQWTRNTHKWHKRQRDIYSDNYAKYGASRMAMEQNLRNYSNRSITEMRRTNQNLRYSQIHRHNHWF